MLMRMIPRRPLAALALALLLALPLAPAQPLLAAPGGGADAAQPALWLRTDPDGNRTLVVWLEDDPTGPYVHKRAAGQASGEFREVGTYTHRWTYQGKPEVTVGVYVVTQGQGLVRIPRVIVEHAPDDVGFANAVSAAVLTDVAGSADNLAPFILETAAPDFSDFTAANLDLRDFKQYPTVVAWAARRVLPGAEAWLGTYLARDGVVETVPGGQQGWRSAELGVVLRDGAQDQRLAGAYVEQRASFVQGASDRQAYSELTVGARTPAGRVPLATARGEDARTGSDLRDPAGQSSSLTLGFQGPAGYVPVAGVRTDVDQRFHDGGVEVTRTTAVGAYIQGAWTPLAGTRYHADRVPLLALPFQLVAGGGLGSNTTGDAELSIGAYPQGAYQPLAQVTLDDTFAGATMKHRTMVSVGAFTPVRYQPLASVTYEGTDSLLDWATRVARAEERGSAWLVSAGPWAGQLYVPLVGVRFKGDAPGTTQPHEAELAVGTFAASYTVFIPLAAAHASSEQAFPGMALRMVTEGMGNAGGPWQAGAGAYSPVDGAFVPAVQVRHRPVQDPEAPRSTDLDVLLADQPVLGVQYRGQKAMVPSFNTLQNPNDDSPWRAAVGAHTPAGYVPLVRVYHDSTGNTILVGPDVEV